MTAQHQWARQALAAAEPSVYWLGDPARPEPQPRLTGGVTADLVVVGGGYTGLWTALRAKERHPDLDVVIVEASSCGDQASGRNGGFVSASLTHGFGKGQARWPDELTELDRIGARNLAAIGETVTRYDLDCGWQQPGELTVATAPHQVDEAGVRRRWPPRRTSPASGTAAAPRWWSPPGWPGDSSTPVVGRGSVSTRRVR